MEQDGQAECTQFQGLSGKQQLGRMQGRIHDYSRSPNLTHLVDKSYIVHDPDLDKAQLKYLYKVTKDLFIHHKAKSIVKMHTKTKDTRAIWEQVCKTYDESISTSMNGDAILGWLAGVQLHVCNWNKPQGKFCTTLKATGLLSCL